MEQSLGDDFEGIHVLGHYYRGEHGEKATVLVENQTEAEGFRDALEGHDWEIVAAISCCLSEPVRIYLKRKGTE